MGAVSQRGLPGLVLGIAVALSAVDLALVLGVSLYLGAFAIDATYWWAALVMTVLAVGYPVAAVLVGRALANELSGYPAGRRLLAASGWVLLPATIIAVIMWLLVTVVAAAAM